MGTRPYLQYGGKPPRLVHFASKALGVPITVYYCANCKTEITKDMLDHLVKLVEANGADIWFEKEAKRADAQRQHLSSANHPSLPKETNILDVCLTPVSHMPPFGKRENLQSPADMYLEGSDQHRG